MPEDNLNKEKKKKVLFQSDITLANTGFGKNARGVLTYLYNTDKYEIYHYCCGITQENQGLLRTPWQSIGSLPADPQKLEELNRDPNTARLASYGSLGLESIIKQIKPDVYIAVQDIWGIDFAIDRPWFKKIGSALWTTLDSLPILPSAVNAAKKVKNFWVWSKFAETALHKQGFNDVKTLHGAIETKNFYKLEEKERGLLRSKFNINHNDFIIGFVFRNQLRKSVPNLLEGFSLFKKDNPEAENSKLLLHTNFAEGWDIHKIAKEYNVKLTDILTTYICQNCREYKISPFTNQNLNCDFCDSKNTVVTTNVSVGTTEEQLNEIYNLMDVYCHPFTSGGQEIPIQEGKLAELVTLVTNYSCGEEMCEQEASSIALDWTEYREHGTEFREASTCPKSIAKELKCVFEMSDEKKSDMGKKARQWVIENYSSETVGKTIEEFIDSIEFTTYDFEFENIQKDPEAKIPETQNESEWITMLYDKILKREQVLDDDDGHKYWMEELRKGVKREEIENYFRQVAVKENSEMNSSVKITDILADNDQGKRILFISPEDQKHCFTTTSLLGSIKKKYPDFNIYVASQYENKLFYVGNPSVFKIIPQAAEMKSSRWLNGVSKKEDFFEVIYSPQNIVENRFSVYTKK